MAVTEVLRAVGSWELALRDDVPKEVWDALGYYGHVAVHAGPIDVRVAGDSALASARYVGVLRKKDHDEGFSIGGGGMALWLGDEDGKGWVIEDPLSIVDKTLEESARLILPPGASAILEGSYFAMPGNPVFTNTFQWVTQREALNYLADTLLADWKVRGDGYLNIGPEGSLFVTNPKTVVLRRDQGTDLTLTAFPGSLETTQKIDDFTTRVVLLASDDNGSVATADADIAGGLNPYKDVHGATLRMTRLIGESSTDFDNAPARAQLQLNRFSGTTDALTLSTADYDVRGTVEVGDYVWVYDPEHDLVNNAVEIIFRGMRINPIKLRLTEMSWPVVSGMSVAYRSSTGSWTDLTPYVEWETGDVTLVVGGYKKALGDGSDGGGGLTPRPNPQPNTTIPNPPTWVTPFLQGVYQSPVSGATKAQTELHWNQPTNTDATAISDGDYYEIRYRTSTVPLFPVTHAQMAVFTHAQLAANGGTFGQPIQYPVTDWQYTRVPFTELRVILYELTPTMPYEAQIRAVDNGTPANAGDWSALTSWQAAQDTIGPATPAAPEVAASLIGVQVLHRLGRADGGTFNLDLDLHHFEVHGLFDLNETLGDGTRLGRMLANSGMIIGQIPVVQRFQVNSTVPLYYKVIAVDEAGNKSLPSPGVAATAQLIDDAHIGSLTVAKITAGTMTASWIMAGEFVTGPVGPRAGFDNLGFFAEDASSNTTFSVDSLTGNVYAIGNFASGLVGERVEINPIATNVPEIWFSTGTSGRHAYINALDAGGEHISLGLNSGESTNIGGRQTTLILQPDIFRMMYNNFGTNEYRGAYIEGYNEAIRIGARSDPAGSIDAFYMIEEMFGGSTGGSHFLGGRFAKTHTNGGYAALYVDQVAGSGTSATVGYGATMQSVPLPFIEIQGTSGSPPTASSHSVTARSNTSFSIQYPAGNCDIFIWAVRYG